MSLLKTSEFLMSKQFTVTR